MLENQDGGMRGPEGKYGTHLMPLPPHTDQLYDLSGNESKKRKESNIGEQMIAQSYLHQVKEDTNFLKDHQNLTIETDDENRGKTEDGGEEVKRQSEKRPLQESDHRYSYANDRISYNSFGLQA